jgi:hypothetical protein
MRTKTPRSRGALAQYTPPSEVELAAAMKAGLESASAEARRLWVEQGLSSLNALDEFDPKTAAEQFENAILGELAIFAKEEYKYSEMDIENIIKPAADLFGLSVEDAISALEERQAKAARDTIACAEAPAEAATPRLENAATETTRPPRRRQWKFVRQPDETLPQFIMREFAPELADGTMTTATLNRYRGLYQDFFNWRRHHDVPPELQNLPTKSQWLRQQVAEGAASSPVRSDEVRRYERDLKRVAAASCLVK